MHELRNFNGQWTPHVRTQGVDSINPLTASPAPAVGTPIGTSAGTPNRPAAPIGPSMSPDLQSAPRTRLRSAKVKFVIAGCVVVVVVGITLAVSLIGGGSGRHGPPTAVDGDSALASGAGQVPTREGPVGRAGTRGNWTQSQWETVVGYTGSGGNHLCVDRALALNLDYVEALPVVKVAKPLAGRLDAGPGGCSGSG